MRNAKRVVKEIGEEFAELSGRSYEFFETYKMDDTELVLVALGSTAGTIKVAVDTMREQGKKVGLLKIRMFRPFPGEEIVEALSGAKKIGILDKSISYGIEGGPLFHEIRSFMYGKTTPIKNVIYGLGGRDITVAHIMEIFGDLEKDPCEGTNVDYFGVRE